MRVLLSGNEAIARGAYEAGVTVAAGYPGTPSSEILENLVKYKDVGIYCEWSTNEKVALEVAAGAAIAGARAIATMKHVGLNVAADPLMTLAYTGIKGGLLVVVADDPGMHSSQNEQDSRNYARFAKVPLLEPSDSQEAKDFVRLGLEISERFDTPVILRSSTRVSHSKGVVVLGERVENPNEVSFEKTPQKYVMVPLNARKRRVRLGEKLKELSEFVNSVECNRLIEGSKELGVITSGVSYQYVAETFPEATILKLGMSFPFPDGLILELASKVERVLVVEELDDFLEEHVRSLGVDVIGKGLVPYIGELNLDILEAVKASLEGRESPKTGDTPSVKFDLPPRPPVMCPGCPHRGLFYALRRFKPVVTGDIGCYSLSVFPPLEMMDTIICMGAGISAAHGMDKAGLERRIVGVIGDSTFFHSGITGLLDIAYNKGVSTIIVLDNRTTAMTGHQEHPGTGKTLMGEPTQETSVEEIARACGIKRVRTVDPYDLKATEKVIGEELEAEEASVIVSRRPCVLICRDGWGEPYRVDPEICRMCQRCLGLGCPAIELAPEGESIRINELLCIGCGMCEQVCTFNAIVREG
jgi:indolepyruvate ferredoxin oxidoreductase alpha subunit